MIAHLSAYLNNASEVHRETLSLGLNPEFRSRHRSVA